MIIFGLVSKSIYTNSHKDCLELTIVENIDNENLKHLNKLSRIRIVEHQNVSIEITYCVIIISFVDQKFKHKAFLIEHFARLFPFFQCKAELHKVLN